MRAQRFGRAAWAVLAWNILVVLWGAFVRATGSGAGCGGHWPLCNGEILPHSPQMATIIEFTHRITSGIALAGVFAVALVARRLFAKGHPARTSAAVGAFFIVTEALLGAGLVLFDYVAHNASAGRAFYLSLHLANTQLLLASLALTAWFATHPERAFRAPAGLIQTGLALALLVSITGAVAALGDTLYPPSSLASGIRQDLSAGSALLLRLRALHPALAVGTGLFLFWVAVSTPRTSAGVRRAVLWVVAATMAQLCAGALNIALLAPVWMQIVHLLLADLLWVGLIALGLESAGDRTVQPAVLRSRAA